MGYEGQLFWLTVGELQVHGSSAEITLYIMLCTKDLNKSLADQDTIAAACQTADILAPHCWGLFIAQEHENLAAAQGLVRADITMIRSLTFHEKAASKHCMLARRNRCPYRVCQA